MINVLFVCIGNSCRSQMAEGFARAYGSDVMNVSSAGLFPAGVVQPLTSQVMLEKNIDIGAQFCKSIHEVDLDSFGVIVNMSGVPLPLPARGKLLNWQVPDPIGQAMDTYLRVREQIEGLVMQLTLDLRRTSNTEQKRAALPIRPVSSSVKSNQKPKAPSKVSPASESSQRYAFGRVRKARD